MVANFVWFTSHCTWPPERIIILYSSGGLCLHSGVTETARCKQTLHMYQVSWVGEGGRPRTYHAFAFERRLAYCHAFKHERWPVYYHAFAFERSSATPWRVGAPPGYTDGARWIQSPLLHLLKVIKEVRWPGQVWAGECFFWYRPTRVVPDKRPLNGWLVINKSTDSTIDWQSGQTTQFTNTIHDCTLQMVEFSS